jgi:type I restriction enzyme M protein
MSMKANLDKAGIANQDAALRQAAGQAFYNTSPFTLRDLRNRASQAQLKADFEAYLDGFSPNVQEILDNFEFRNQVPKLSKADVLGTLIEKFLDSSINLGPAPVLHGDGSVKHLGLDNHAMGTMFEEHLLLHGTGVGIDEDPGSRYRYPFARGPRVGEAPIPARRENTSDDVCPTPNDSP